MNSEEAKKLERKLKRFSARLKNSKGVTCTDIPGPNIIICNAGQATGLGKEFIIQLISYLSLNITVPKFIAEKGESHSFLSFKNTEDAKLFMKSLNGIIKHNGTPLFLNFVENVPNTETICPHDNPEGLILLKNFISQKEEQEFLQLFDWIPEDSSALKNRQVKHYGYEFRYGSNDVDLNFPLEEKIPVECNFLWKRLAEYGIYVEAPDQLTVNKYMPGQGIPSHVDKHSPFGDTILSLSLGSSVVMDWKHHTGVYVPIVIEARSLLVMGGKARYDWQHGIQPRTWDPIIEQRVITEEGSKKVRVITSDTVPRMMRISLTFRWTRIGPCVCSYKTLCDSVKKSSADDIDDSMASILEDIHVHQVYEQIAGHFSTTRHKPWPKVVDFMRGVPAGSVVVDLGCGNGKNIVRRNDILQLAGERSSGLLEECRRTLSEASTAQCVRLDMLHAGIRDCCADYIICIAVIHHFSTRGRRLQALSTIHRLLRTNGQALITVWAKDQTESNYLCKTKGPSQTEHVEVICGSVNLPVHENRTQFQHKDLLVPWKLRKRNEEKLADKPDDTLLRYYHVFEEGELDNLCKEVGLEVVRSFSDEGNLCVVCKKNCKIYFACIIFFPLVDVKSTPDV